ncbi:MAG: histidine kinase [Ilumatobacteraceae bacterium]
MIGRYAMPALPRPFVTPRSLAFGLAVAVLPVTVPVLVRGENFGVIDLVATVLALALLLLRRWLPAPAFGVALVVTVVCSAVAHRPTAMLPVLVVLLYTVASVHTRRLAVLAGIVSVGVTVVVVGSLFEQRYAGPATLAAVAWPALAAAAGEATRNRNAYIAEVEARALRAEQTREEEARRRVVEERLRIARELHDVVAHRMAVITVQSGVALHFLRDEPDDAEAALKVVRTSAATVLDELSVVLNVLRATGETSAPSEPTPTLAELAVLVTSFEAAGLVVHWTSRGEPRPMADAVQLAAYRVVQEGLTNAHKHGDGEVALHTEYAIDGLHIRIENRFGDGGVSPSNGFGLVGMQERVSAAAGTLQVDADGGTFRITATLPLLCDSQAMSQ